MPSDDALEDKVLAAIAPPIGGCPVSYTFASGGGAAVNSLSIPTPESPVGETIEGNLLVATLDLNIPNYLPLGVPSGWIPITTTVIDNTGNINDFSKLTFYKVATANEPLSYTWTFGNPARVSGGVVCIETAATSYSVFSKNDYPTNVTTITSSGVTTSANNTLVFAFFGAARGNDVITGPATWTSLYTVNTSGALGSTGLAAAKSFAVLGPTGPFSATCVQSSPKSVHVVGVECLPKTRASGTATVQALSSLNAVVTNLAEAGIISNASSGVPATEVNKILPPGSLALADSTSLAIPLLIGESASQVVAYANADSGALVNNVMEASTLAEASTSLTAHVDNPFPMAEVIIQASASLESSVIKNIDDDITCTATSGPLVSSIIRNSFPTSVTCTAFARLSTPQPVKPKTTTTVAVSTPRVEVYPIIRIL